MKDTNTPRGRLLPGDQVITEQDIQELGLEEAPADIGLSVEEVEDLERRRSANG
jgi:hypothetical protein